MSGRRVLTSHPELINLVIDLQSRCKKKGIHISQREATRIIAQNIRKNGGLIAPDDNFIWL